jgi:hypothetical protein
MKTLSLSKDPSPKQTKYEALQESKKRIREAWVDNIDSMWVIGRELIRMDQEDLCESEGKTFQEYVEFDIGISYDTAKRWMRAHPVLDLLKVHNLQNPNNETQLLELSKLREPEKLVTVWKQIIVWGIDNKLPVTSSLVRDVVTAQRRNDGEFQTRASTPKPRATGIKIDLGGNGTAEPASGFSEEGERALNRIRRLCGDAYADAVLAENPKVSENDLIRWSEEENEMVKNLGYWIVIKQWSLRKALNYEAKTIDENTSVEQLSDLARSRGGRAYAEWKDVRITVEIAS